MLADVLDRLPSEECIDWPGHIDREGYGLGWDPVERRLRRASRLVWERSGRSALAPDVTLDHLCRRRPCVNPAHLEPVTIAENLRRAPTQLSTVNAAKVACPAGHAYDEANTYVDKRGLRHCRRCQAARARARRASP